MNGRPGDDPILDVLRHDLIVYGEPIDGQLRQLEKLMSMQRLQDWFLPLRDLPHAELKTVVAEKLQELQRDARSRGWEV